MQSRGEGSHAVPVCLCCRCHKRSLASPVGTPRPPSDSGPCSFLAAGSPLGAAALVSQCTKQPCRRGTTHLSLCKDLLGLDQTASSGACVFCHVSGIFPHFSLHKVGVICWDCLATSATPFPITADPLGTGSSLFLLFPNTALSSLIFSKIEC